MGRKRQALACLALVIGGSAWIGCTERTDTMGTVTDVRQTWETASRRARSGGIANSSVSVAVNTHEAPRGYLSACSFTVDTEYGSATFISVDELSRTHACSLLRVGDRIEMVIYNKTSATWKEYTGEYYSAKLIAKSSP